MRLLEAHGTPYEIGCTIGEQARDLVARAVEVVCRFDLDDRELDARLGAVEKRLAQAFPETLEEARGLADGAGIAPRDALALSVCSDLTGRLPAWCSLLAVPGPAGTVVGKNLDSTLQLAELQVVERLAPASKLRYLHVTTAGAMWTDGGVNEAGLALVNASLEPSTSDPEGVPDGILARELLARCEDVAEAVAFASGFSVRTLGENMLVADAEGTAAVIEKLPGGQAVRKGAAVAACNHVLSPGLAGRMSAADPVRANSLRRFERLEGASRADRRWTAEAVRELLSDPGGGVLQDGDAGLHTIASLVLAPAERKVWVGRTGRPAVELPVQAEGTAPATEPREEEVEDGLAR